MQTTKQLSALQVLMKLWSATDEEDLQHNINFNHEVKYFVTAMEEYAAQSESGLKEENERLRENTVRLETFLHNQYKRMCEQESRIKDLEAILNKVDALQDGIIRLIDKQL